MTNFKSGLPALVSLLGVVLVLGVSGCPDQKTRPPTGRVAMAQDTKLSDTAFVGLVERLSEPGGYFDTDNLISNETSYLHPVSELERLGIRGGAYIGVGPDQNFSYIAAVRPRIAYIIDIRRDNLLQQLMFKAIFVGAGTRLEYLATLLGRPRPDDPRRWEHRSIEDLVRYIDERRADPASAEAAQARVLKEVRGFGFDLSEADLETIRRFHRAFIDQGLDLRFSSHGRAPLSEYPTYRRLLLETDLDGRRSNYLAGEDDFQFVKSLQAKGLIVPVVGDLAGDHAMRAIGEHVRQLGESVTVFYTSNVEFYLMNGRTFDRFARNVLALPLDEDGMIIRAYFGRRLRHPDAVPGHVSTQLLQRFDDFTDNVAGQGYRGYYDLILRPALETQIPERR